MNEPARRLRLVGAAPYREEAEALLERPGDASLVERGVTRAMVLKCPDGCGETLVVNLDPRSGKAWRLDRRQNSTTVYPSVWLDGGCKSHFIVWRDAILWCERFEDGNVEPAYDPALEDAVLEAVPFDRDVGPAEVGDALDALAWDVAKALRRLASRGAVQEGAGRARGCYRRR